MNLTEELALVKQAQTGNKNSLEQLCDYITPKLYGYLLNTLRNSEIAEDLLQETWLKAIGALNSFKPRGVRFSAWIFAIAHNVCREYWRNKKPNISISELFIEPSDGSVYTQLVEEKISIETIFSKISADDQELLRLRYIAELSFKEIAVILTISPLAARVRLYRTLVRARSILNEK